MNERIKLLRKELGLTQEQFGQRLGVTRGAITNIEYNKVEPKPLFVDLICREFDVNEQWLRTGEGEMFHKKSRDQEIAAFMGNLLKGEVTFKRRFISVLSQMSTEEWELLEQKMREILDDSYN